jgi:AcrR family transcriptional regulator
MPPTVQVDSKTKSDILRKAEQLFAARGYDGVSMREIAEACAITKANIYYYFKSKESLYLQVLETDLLALVETLERASQRGETCRDKITNIVESFLNLMQEQQTLLQITMREFGGLEREIRGLVRRYRTQLTEPIERALEEGKRVGELRSLSTPLTAVSLLGMMSIFLTKYLLDLPVESMETQTSHHTVELFFEGVRAR